MSFISTILQTIRRPSAKHLVIGAIFSLAMVGSVGLGLSMRGHSSAQVSRDCDHNSIDYQPYPNAGDCGAANPQELVADARNNVPGDLQAIYNYGGLPVSQYDQFASSAQEGVINKDGTVVVHGDTVIINAWTMGRTSMGLSSSVRHPVNIAGNTYYYSAPQYSFASDVTSIPVMVMFDANGTAQAAIMNPCGNVVGGNKVPSSVTCQALNAAQSKDNPNMYTFTTSASFMGNAKFTRVVYHFSDTNTDVQETSLTTGVEHTFTKDADVTVTVYASVPGGHEIASSVETCKKHITFTPPMFVCTALVATAVDDNTFRFTIKTAQDSHTTVKNADFILDNTQTTAGVDAKDSNGNIFKEYTFTDQNSHTVKVTVYFNTLEGVKSDSGHCTATVTPKQQPKCTVPGHENEAPNSPTCGFCQPGIPMGSPQCTPPQTPPTQLVNTGPGSVIALFAGTTITAFFAHKFFLSRRLRRAATLAAAPEASEIL
ncbi:MAG TPA: hypothetical protein VKQ34_04525 [Candidatus Saccharimonadales bacterium]|nr:hypothetical protein [Candidatus Saccharimonadales bacterium]